VDINQSLELNLWRLLIFIILANIIASIVSSLLSRSGALAQERLQRQKMQEFLGDAAHELRTPMTVVKGYAELLKGKQLDAKGESAAFDRLNGELKRMDFLVSDLLMLAQLGEEGNIDFESINVADLVRENIAEFQEIAPNHPVTTQVDQNATLMGSEKYLQRFIKNALTNIRLHTPDGTGVRITVRNDKQIVIVIEDSGPGLPEQSYGEKIRGLKRFDRSRSRETGGTGLGMSIMNAVIERHKGTFTLRKSELGGLAIEVHLPRT
jgi:signal transduction histidine kinase